MQLEQLQYFCTLARLGNMKRAANELWITQSGLSRSISSLEAEIGVKLFDRFGRSISLNKAGGVFYEQVMRALHLIDEAVQLAQDADGSGIRTLKVLVLAGNFSSSWLRQKFQRYHPEIDLMMKSSYSASAFDVINYDFLVYATPTRYNNLESIKLLEERLMLAMGCEHPLAAKEVITLLDTLPYAYQCLPENENLHRNLVNFCNQAGFSPKIALCTEDSFSFFSDLAITGYITLLPEHTAFTTINGKIVLKPIKGPPDCKRTIYLGWNKDRTVTPDMRQFIDFCLREYSPDAT